MATAIKHIVSPADLALAQAGAKRQNTKPVSKLPIKTSPESSLAAAQHAAVADSEAAAKAMVDFYADKRVRKGKTKKDAINGQKSKSAQNKDTRAMWQGDSKRAVHNFPWSSCNGKRNVYQFTGKGGHTIYTRTQQAAAAPGKVKR